MLTSRNNWLILGRIGYGFKGMGIHNGKPGMAVRLPRLNIDPDGAVVWLRYRDVVGDRVQTWENEAGPALEYDLTVDIPVWTHSAFDDRPEARRDLVDVQRDPALAPIFLVSEPDCASRTSQERAVFCCTRIRASGMLFVRVWEGDSVASEPLPATIRRAVLADSSLTDRVSDENQQTVSFFEDTEIEYKFTFRQPVSIWQVTSQFAELVHDERLDGFAPDVGNELQRWSYNQHTFALEENGDSLGYIAFMETNLGDYFVKHKLFPADSMRRTETFDPHVRIDPEEFVSYVARKYPTSVVKPLPFLTRTRFDVNVQSRRTGHFYGIEVDEVHAAGSTLQQLEIEYHRTQVSNVTDSTSVESELYRLRDLVRANLTNAGLAFEEGFLSKLTYLLGLA